MVEESDKWLRREDGGKGGGRGENKKREGRIWMNRR